jgi:hypothetical protein
VTSLDQNTPLSAERLAEIRDLNVDSCSADAPFNPDVWALEKARTDLLAEVDRLNSYCNSIDRLNEIADADWKQEVDRLKAERDEARRTAQNMAAALVKVGTVMENAARTAAELGAGAGMDAIIGYLSDAGMLPEPSVQPVPDGGDTR